MEDDNLDINKTRGKNLPSLDNQETFQLTNVGHMEHVVIQAIDIETK